MAAPKGNKYYLMQSKHGRDKEFETPEQLYEAFLEYLEWSQNNPLYINDVIRGGKEAGTKISIEKERPLSINKFASYLGMSPQGIRNYGDKESHKAFFEIYTRIENDCHTQKIERAEIGDYNANIVSRVLGLEDKSKIDHSSKDRSMSPIAGLTNEQLEERLNLVSKLEKK